MSRRPIKDINRPKSTAAILFPLLLTAWQNAAASQCISDALDEGHDHGDLSEIDTLFALIDETGSVVVSLDLFDEPSLVYFGYTFCPDVCPVDNARNAAAVDILSSQGHVVKPVFITVDPTRDTPEIMREYTDLVHPEMIGITGTVEQISLVAKSFGVEYSDAVPEDDYYLVDHTTFSYFILPEQGVVDRFSRAISATDLAERIACHISQK